MRFVVMTAGLLLLLPVASSADTVYLCKTYSGGEFWSKAHCGKHNALIQRIVNVPDGLPFDQQVHLGQQAQAQAEGARLAAPPQPVQTTQQPTQTTRAVDCAALANRIHSLDAVARQGQSAQSQDRIRQERQAARDAQLRGGCRS